MLNKLLDPNERYTFSDYFDTPLAVRDILRGFSYGLEQRFLGLPVLAEAESVDLSLLKRTIELNRRRTRLDSH